MGGGGGFGVAVCAHMPSGAKQCFQKADKAAGVQHGRKGQTKDHKSVHTYIQTLPDCSSDDDLAGG